MRRRGSLPRRDLAAYGVTACLCLASAFVVLAIPVSDSVAAIAPPEPREVLKRLRPGHPRLILTDSGLSELRSRVATDPVLAGYLDQMRERGERVMEQPPLKRALAGATGMLSVSFAAGGRIPTLALLYRLDGDRRWADRAIAEMRVVAAFTDWHPEHFLDVAEMTAAVSFGYDWLYDVLSPEDRAAISAALIEKALKPALPFYRGEVDLEKNVPWAQASLNWNLWCNGGIVLGALAVAEDDPELSGKVLHEALLSMPVALEVYAPDGGYPEGPSYWATATQYTLHAAHSLYSALGSDFGIMSMPGLSATCYFPSAVTGPSGEAFNYADASAGAGWRSIQYGLARWYRDPALAYLARERSRTRRATPFDLIWYSAEGTAEDVAALPRDHRFSRIQVATMRSSWTDPNAVFVGLKAGSNSAPHAHLDLGSFVLDVLGLRWADDLGRDSYDLPGYWDYEGQRGSYYRLGTMGHNTLMLDGKNQDPKATAKIIQFGSSDDRASAIVDLSDAYAPAGATRVRRGVALLDQRQRVLIQDEVATKQPSEVVWSMHTRADIDISPDGRRATLIREGKSLDVQLLAPADAQLSSEEVTVSPPQDALEGERKLLIRLAGRTDAARIAVVLSPSAGTLASPVLPLDEWR